MCKPCWALALLAGLLASGPALGAGVGVAPFERMAAEGQGVPDVASRLAERLGTLGLDPVVGPDRLGATARAEPPAEDAAAWAAGAGVDYLVVGRTTRLGNALSVDVRILDGRTGHAMGGRLIEEANRPDDMGRLIDGLANQVLERIEAGGAAPAAAPGVSAARPSPAGAPPATARRAGGPAGPISIRSDELEAFDRPGEKKFVFTGNVRATQDGLVIHSDRLEAFYPPGSSQPERLVATGRRVVLEQEGRTAHCQKAVYFRADERIECTGDAVLFQDCDQVRGDMITFYMRTDVMKVTGKADVKLRPDDPQCATTAAAREDP
jgi:lipopolysaccharide transport protein LptA